MHKDTVASTQTAACNAASYIIADSFNLKPGFSSGVGPCLGSRLAAHRTLVLKMQRKLTSSQFNILPKTSDCKYHFFCTGRGHKNSTANKEVRR